MLHWGNSLLLPLLLTRVLGDFMPNLGNLERVFFFFFGNTVHD